MGKNNPQFTPLIQAAATGNAEAVHFLLETGANLEGKDHLGRTALIHAVRNQHVRIVEMLVDAGANIEAVDDTGGTPMRYANRVKNEDILQALRGDYGPGEDEDLLLAAPKRASAYQIQQRRRRFWMALATLVLVFVSWRVFTFVQRTRTCAMLMEAANNDDISGMTAHLVNGLDPNVANQRNTTPLMFAAEGGHTEIVNVLLKYHADPNLKDANGATALRLAGITRPEIVEALLQYGADPNAADKNGKTLLSVACETGGHALLIHLLLQHGADPNVKGDNGPPLVSLIEMGVEGNTPLVKEMLSKGANANVSDAAGTPALVWVAERGNVEIAKMLLEKKADPNAKDALEERTALHLAAREEQTELVRLLLEKNANASIADKNGETPLIYALSGLTQTDQNRREACAEILRLLISRGANLHARDSLSRTALQFALEKKQLDMASLLRQEGAKE